MIEKIKIENREQWLALRHQDVTGTGAPVLFGVSKYQTPRGLYHAKKDKNIEEDNDEPLITDDEISIGPMPRGLLMEDPAEKMFRQLKPDWKIEKNTFYYRDPDLRAGATPDLIVRDPMRPGIGVVNIKNPEASVYRKWVQEDGSIQPPVEYAIQNILEAYLTGASWAAIGAFVVSHRTTFRLIQIQIHQGILERIKAEVAEFWKRIAEERPYPFDYARDGALIAATFRETGEVISLESDNLLPVLLDEREELSEQSSNIKKRLDAIRAELLGKLNGATEARVADGRIIKVKRVNVKEHVVPANSYLRLTINESKA